MMKVVPSDDESGLLHVLAYLLVEASSFIFFFSVQLLVRGSDPGSPT